MVRRAKKVVEYMHDRLTEPSTQAGIAAMSLFIGHNVDNAAAVGACNTVGVVCGALAILFPENSEGTS